MRPLHSGQPMSDSYVTRTSQVEVDRQRLRVPAVVALCRSALAMPIRRGVRGGHRSGGYCRRADGRYLGVGNATLTDWHDAAPQIGARSKLLPLGLDFPAVNHDEENPLAPSETWPVAGQNRGTLRS